MQRAIIFALLLFLPSLLHARVIKWQGKPLSVSISTERLTRIEFPENLRSVFLSRSDIGVERKERSLYVRALAPDVDDALFVVGESGTTYEDGILEGDYVIIRRQDTAEDGDIVCALIGDEATLKRFYRRGREVTLKPANKNYDPIVVSKGEFRILGKVTGVIRKL